MKELTDEQIRLAREAFAKDGGVIITSTGLRAVAPFLQLPWDEPTVDEAERLHNHNARTVPAYMGTFQAIGQFVRGRNAALNPKPVDPRIDMVKRIVQHFLPASSTGICEEITERVVAAIDEVKA